MLKPMDVIHCYDWIYTMLLRLPKHEHIKADLSIPTFDSRLGELLGMNTFVKESRFGCDIAARRAPESQVRPERPHCSVDIANHIGLAVALNTELNRLDVFAKVVLGLSKA